MGTTTGATTIPTARLTFRVAELLRHLLNRYPLNRYLCRFL